MRIVHVSVRTLIYKRTHCGDPDPHTGEFGCNDCMKSVRGRRFDAVIGIGGVGQAPRRHGIAGRLTWIGIGPHKFPDPNHPNRPRVRFDHFWYRGKDGPLLENDYPALARRMFGGKFRVVRHSPLSPIERRTIGPGAELDREVKAILDLGHDAPPSTVGFTKAGSVSCERARRRGRAVLGNESSPSRAGRRCRSATCRS